MMKNFLQYRMVVEGYDPGPFVTKLIINCTKEKSPNFLNAVNLCVTVTKQSNSYDANELVTSNRKVTAAYVSDENGNITNEESPYITFELEVDNAQQIGSPFRFILLDKGENKRYMGNQWANPYSHTLTVNNEIYELERTGVISPIADKFDKNKKFMGTDSVALQYTSYTPHICEEVESPLIIWLHGAGEGSWFETENTDIAILGNKVVALADKHIQNIMGGAYVLAPQVPTMWMDDGTGAYTQNGVSKYETVLIELIKHFIESNPKIDRRRVYIGGCSNGGFMTMRTIIDHPYLFAAAFPVCQAFKPEWAEKNQLEEIAKMPIWQIHAKNDNSVPFKISEETHNCLVELGAKNIYHTWYDNMGVYNGHFAWIPVYNNNVYAIINEKRTSLFVWLAAQQK